MLQETKCQKLTGLFNCDAVPFCLFGFLMKRRRREDKKEKETGKERRTD